MGVTGEKSSRLVFDRQAQLRQAAGALRPVAFIAGSERGQVLLIGKARQAVVGLRLEIGMRDASRRHGGKQRQAGAMQEVVDKRGDKDRLARPRQPGDAEADCRCTSPDAASPSEPKAMRVSSMRPVMALSGASRGGHSD